MKLITVTDKVKAIQKAIGSLPDGKFGPATTDAFFKYLESKNELSVSFPYESEQFGCYVITGKPQSLVLKNTKGNHSVSTFPYSMSGSFTTIEGNGSRVPLSIMVNNGVVIRNDACHSAPWDGGKPETVLYYTTDGKHGTELVMNATSLMNKIPNIMWAIGGASLNPVMSKEEGFTGKFSDIYRYTQHNAIGFDRYDNIVGVFCKKCTGLQMQEKCKAIGLHDVLLLDGGSISAINAGSLKYNTYLKQGYCIQF